MRTVSTIFAMTMVATLAFAAACSTKTEATGDDDDTSTKKDGGKTGDDDDDTTGASCADVCAVSDKAECSGDKDCVEECEGITVPKACKTDYNAFTACYVKLDADSFECNDDDKATLKGSACEDELKAFTDCLTEEAGGGKGDAGGGDCESCVLDKCADENTACGKNQDCKDLVTCINACPAGDEECATACGDEHQDGVDDANALATCIQSSCETECTAP